MDLTSYLPRALTRRRGDAETRRNVLSASPRPRVPASRTPWLGHYTKLVAASTLFLVFAGAMVTSTGSGLAVPDWPFSYGRLFPPMVGGIFYEHGHRMVAATVGFLTIIQAVWLQGREPKRFVRRLGWISLGAVIAQGLLGGLTVLFLLPPAISISHAALAEIFLCLNVAIAFFTSRFYGVRRPSRRFLYTAEAAALQSAGNAIVAVVFVQILIGALMRHLQAGLAIPDFPLSFGRLVPEFSSTAVAVNYAHRVGAIFVALLAFGIAGRVWRFGAPPLRRIYNVLGLAILAQIALGGATVWTGKHPLTTSLHVVTGALILGTSLVFALTARITPELARGTRHPAPGTPQEAPA